VSILVAWVSLLPATAGAQEFLRGDSNADRRFDISDPQRTLGFLFLGSTAPPCPDAADADDNGVLEITDAILSLNFLFVGGRAPPPPFPDRGEDPTFDALICGSPGAPRVAFEGELGGGAVSPDGRTLAFLSPETSEVIFADGSVRFVGALRTPGRPTALNFSLDSRLAFVGTVPDAIGLGGEEAGDGEGAGFRSAQVHIVDLATARIVASIDTGAPGLDLLGGPHATAPALLFAVSRTPLQGLEGVVSAIDVSARRLAARLPVPPRPHAHEFVLAGRGLAVSSEAGMVTLIDTRDLRVLTMFSGFGVPTDLMALGDGSVIVANGDIGPAFHVQELMGEERRAASRLRGPVNALAFDTVNSMVWTIDPEHTSLRFEEIRSGIPTGRTGVVPLDIEEAPDVDPHFGGSNLAAVSLGGQPALMFPMTNDRIGVLDLRTHNLLGASHLGGEVRRIHSIGNGSLAGVVAGNRFFLGSASQFVVDRIRIDLTARFRLRDFFPLTGDRCRDNVAILIDDGLDDPATSLAVDSGGSSGGARIFTSQTQNAVARFYQIMPDIFDYCVIFWASDWAEMMVGGEPVNVQPEIGAAFHSWTKNFTRGIGAVWTPCGGRFGNQAGSLTPPLTTKRLQSRVNMNDLADWGDGQTLIGRSGTAIFAQELGHRFISFVDTSSVSMQIRRDNAHYSHFFNANASAVGGRGGNLITEVTDGSFRIDGQESTFPPLDEYLMGLLPPGSVPDTFRVRNASDLPAGAPPFDIGDTFDGTRTNVTLQDIIDNEGDRLPNSTLSQRVFTVGVGLCVPEGGTWASDIEELDGIFEAIKDFYATETEGKAHLVIKNCPLMFSQDQPPIPTGASAGGVAIHPLDGRIFVSNLNAGTVSIIDGNRGSASFNTVIDTIDVLEPGDEGLRPIDLDLNLAGSRLFVVLQNTGAQPNGKVKVYNTATLARVATFDAGDDPRAIAVVKFGPLARGFVANRGSSTITVFGSITNDVLSTINTDVSLPRDVAVSEDGLVVLWTNTGDSTVVARHVLSGVSIPVTLPDSPFKLALVQNESVVNNSSARALASDTPPALVYVTSTSGNRVYPMDLKTLSGLGTHTFDRLRTTLDGAGSDPVGAIVVDPNPQGVTFLGNGAVALVTHRNSPATVSIIETANHRVLDTVTLGSSSGAVDVKVTRDGDRAYVACEVSGDVVPLE
jgi:DNA-binding beta-propeller fold protein YncE